MTGTAWKTAACGMRALAAALLLALPAAWASTLQITVLAADGRPLPDAVVVVQPAAAGATPRAPTPVRTTVQQERMRFQPALLVVPLGSSVRFTNVDPFDHHVRARPAAGDPLATRPEAGFELRLSGASAGRPGGSQEVQMSQPGPLELGCHLHSRMRGHIYVADTPWVVKTDANGQASVADVPDGAARVTVWHPDQIVPGAPQAVAVQGDAALRLPTAITPRRR